MQPYLRALLSCVWVPRVGYPSAAVQGARSGAWLNNSGAESGADAGAGGAGGTGGDVGALVDHLNAGVYNENVGKRSPMPAGRHEISLGDMRDRLTHLHELCQSR